MPNNAQRTVTIVVRPNNDTLSAGSITNNVAISTDTPETDSGNNTNSLITPIDPPAFDLLVNKTGDIDPLAVGDDVIYSVTVTNLGPSAAENVVLVDDMPPTRLGFQSVSSPADVSCTTSGGTPTINPDVGPTGVEVSCTIPYLGEGESRTVMITGRGQSKGTATNAASVSADGSNLYETNTSNDSATLQTTVRTRTDVRVNEKVPSLAAVNLNDDFSFTIEVENVADISLLFGEADGVLVADSLPSNMVLTAVPTSTDATCTAAIDNTSFECDFGTMFSGQISTILVPVRVISVSENPETFENTASITTESRDTVSTNNSSAGSVVVRSSSITGRVFRDFNDNALVTAGADTGVGGVRIDLAGTDTDDEPISRFTTTLADGTYEFDLLPEGSYTVTRSAITETYQTDGTNTAGTGGATYTALTSPTINLGDNEELDGYLFAIVPQARIGLAKAVTASSLNANDGTFDVTFGFVVENFSLEPLNAVSLTDTLAGNAPLFGTYVASAVGMPRGSYTIITAPVSTCGGANRGVHRKWRVSRTAVRRDD